MQSFPWKKFGGNYWNNPPAPTVVVEFAGPDGPVAIEGLFDTGADSTELAYELIHALGITFDRCAAMKAHGQWRPFSVVEARLDGQVFDLPVTFTPDVDADGSAINLFGRIGILDRFRIRHDPVASKSEFEWVEGPRSPIVAAYDNWLLEWLETHPGGFVEGENYE